MLLFFGLGMLGLTILIFSALYPRSVFAVILCGVVATVFVAALYWFLIVLAGIGSSTSGSQAGYRMATVVVVFSVFTLIVYFVVAFARLAGKRSQFAKAFLIRCVEGTWFKLHESQFPEVLRPSSLDSRPVDGAVGKRIAVGGGQMEFSYRADGIEVRYQGDSLSEGEIIQIVKEIAERVTTATGQPSEVVSL